MSEGYNGWTNYETWCVTLWMDNEQGSQEFFLETAQEHYDASAATKYSTREQVARYRLANWLKEHHEENRPELPGVYGDLLGGALSEVNWDHIAAHYIDAVLEEVGDAN